MPHQHQWSVFRKPISIGYHGMTRSEPDFNRIEDFIIRRCKCGVVQIQFPGEYPREWVDLEALPWMDE